MLSSKELFLPRRDSTGELTENVGWHTFPTETGFHSVYGYMHCEAQMEFLYHLGLHNPTGLEIGSFMGLSAILIGLGMKHSGRRVSRLVCVDTWGTYLGHENVFETFMANVNAFGLGGIIDTVKQASRDVSLWGWAFDFCYIDGDHSTEGVITDCKLAIPRLASGGLCVFHDVDMDSVRDGIALAEKAFRIEPAWKMESWGVWRKSR